MIAINRRTDKHPVRIGPLGSARGGGHSLRTALLAGASLIPLAALGAPEAARACSGATQTISAPTTGPINSNGEPITVGAAGTIYYGVSAVSCSITALTNNGMINGGPGAYGPQASGVFSAIGVTIGTITNNSGGTISGRTATEIGKGGSGVSNSGTITTLNNSGAIKGVSGISGGGAGVSNSGTITTLTNNATISGGSANPNGGTGGAGVSNLHQITTLTNFGTISGGKGVRPVPGVGPGGAGVFNAMGATIGSLINKTTGMILGASGSTAAGAGVSNAGTITNLTNSGTIAGGTDVLELASPTPARSRRSATAGLFGAASPTHSSAQPAGW